MTRTIAMNKTIIPVAIPARAPADRPDCLVDGTFVPGLGEVSEALELDVPLDGFWLEGFVMSGP
jgi:hypothetical protein